MSTAARRLGILENRPLAGREWPAALVHGQDGGGERGLDTEAAELNGRPRKLLGWKTAAEAYIDAHNLVKFKPAVD